MAHFTLDLREEFRAGVVDPFLAGHAAGVTPNPCVGCNGHVRLDAMVDFADALGAATLATGHYARVTPDGLLRAAADDAKDQTYMLVGRFTCNARAPRLPARRADQARGPRAGRRGGAAGRLQGRLAGPVLPGRHRQGRVPRPPRGARGPPGGDRRRRRARARAAPRRAPLHGRPAQGPRRGRAGAAVRARHRHARQPRRGRHPRRAGDPRGAAARRAAAPGRRRGRPGQAALPLPRRSRAGRSRAAAGGSSWSCSSPSTAPRRGRPPACCAAT